MATTGTIMNSSFHLNCIEEIHTYLAVDIERMNQLIQERLATANEELIGIIGKHLIDAGGKRIRPLLTILISKMFNYTGNDHIKLAAAVEFIHTATLLHDDVVDDGTVRRFKPTANVLWGSKASILVGDFLFSQSFQLMVATRSIVAMESLSRAAVVISEGEVAQLVKLQQRRMITVPEYEQIIYAKTAELFAAACEVGAIIAAQAPTNCKLLWEFGIVLGNIFQVTDDLLDYYGNEADLGKNVAGDFYEGKVTLPLIFLHNCLSSQHQIKLQDTIKNNIRSHADFLLIKELMDQFNIKEHVAEYLDNLQKKAHYLLSRIEVNNRYKQDLTGLVKFAGQRVY